MVGDRQQPPDDHGNLSQARTDFLEGLEQRVGSLRAAVEKLRTQPSSPQGRVQVLRRVHALAASAKVLGFAAMAEQIARVERALAEEVTALKDPEFEGILSTLAALPGLANTAARRSLRAPGRHSEPALVLDLVPPASTEPRPSNVPVSVLLIGDEDLERALSVGAPGAVLEIERVPSEERALERIQAAMPDVVVADSALIDSRALLRTLRSDPMLRLIPVVTVRPEGAREDSEPRGLACTLARPVRGSELWAAVQRATQSILEEVEFAALNGEVSMDELIEHLVQELRKGLTPQPTGEAPARIPLGHGSEVLAPLWGALARIRRTISGVTAGSVSFASTGPGGGVVLAPPSRAEELQSARHHAEGVSLGGRRALVVDDDPEVVKFISGLLTAAGADVTTASDGQRALEVALATWPDIVVSDILMPRLDGLELCRELKRDIVLRDTPVVLLSWKEDLLLRLRELRSEADGYLRKEAGASSVLRTISELLAPRAHVAARLAAGGEVRGRLDGLTPRLILELAIAHRPDSCVSLRDAAYLYEVEIRGGAPRRVTRTASDGGFERGERVLAGLLGIGAGRFAVVQNDAPCRDDLQASLRQLLEKPIRKARVALAATRAERLADIDRVVIDQEAIERYLPAMPRRASALLQQVADGASPRALLSSGGLPEGLLLTVLTDLARRGALSAVLIPGGEDLLDMSGVSSTAADGEQPPPGPPMFSFQLSPAPPAVGGAIDAVRAAAKNELSLPGPRFDGRMGPVEPVLAASIPPKTGEVDAAWSSRPPQGGSDVSVAAEAVPSLLPTIDLSLPPIGGPGQEAENGGRSPALAHGAGEEKGHRRTVGGRETAVARLPEFSRLRPNRVTDDDDAPTRVAEPSRIREEDGPPPREEPLRSAAQAAASGASAQPERTVDLADAVARAVATPTTEPPPVDLAPSSDTGHTRARPISVPPRTSLTPKPAIPKVAAVPPTAPLGREARPAPKAALEEGGAAAPQERGSKLVRGRDPEDSSASTEASSEPGAQTADGSPSRDRDQLRATGGDSAVREPNGRVALAAIPLVKAIGRRQFAVRDEVDVPPGQTRDRDARGAAQRPAVTRMVHVGQPAEDSSESADRGSSDAEKPRWEERAQSTVLGLPRAQLPQPTTVEGAHGGSVGQGDAEDEQQSSLAGLEPEATGIDKGGSEDEAAGPRFQSSLEPEGSGVRAVGDEGGIGGDSLFNGRVPLEDWSHNLASPSDAAPEPEGAAEPTERGGVEAPDEAPERDDHGSEPAAVPLVTWGGWIKSAAAMVGAAVGAFALVWWAVPKVIEKSDSDVQQSASIPERSRDDASQPSGPAPSAETRAVATEELPLPDGYTLPAGKALLEIDTGGSHIIYVDGEFVGRGPLRYVTLDPGAHEVKTKLDDRERNDSVNVRAGVRVRLPLAEAWSK